MLVDSIDTKILSALKKREMHASLIAVVLNLPRTTVTYHLKRLNAFHKVESKNIGRKTVWRLAKARIHNKEHFKVFSGIDFHECYKTLFLLPKEALIYGVQGSQAGAAEFRNVPEYVIQDIHNMFKRRKILMRAVTNKKILGALESISDALRTSHTGRTQGVKLVDNLLMSHGELFVTKDFAILANPEKKRGVVIKEHAVVSLLYDFMSLFFTLSDQLDTFDLNAHLTRK